MSRSLIAQQARLWPNWAESRHPDNVGWPNAGNKKQEELGVQILNLKMK
jgi:hypothetical protein